MPLNSLGQPIGDPVSEWRPPHLPARVVLNGRYCVLEPLDAARHTRDLWAAYATADDLRHWTYLINGPFTSLGEYESWVSRAVLTTDPLFYAVIQAGRAVGVAAYLRIAPEAGSIEVGHINFSPLLQRTPAATEAMFLMMRQAFELGYRRYEWKCDSLNAPSRAAAQRLGLSYRGHLPSGARLQGAQPRLRVVRGDRHRVAGARSRVRTLALSGQLRFRRPPEGATLRADGGRPGQSRLEKLLRIQPRSHEEVDSKTEPSCFRVFVARSFSR